MLLLYLVDIVINFATFSFPAKYFSTDVTLAAPPLKSFNSSLRLLCVQPQKQMYFKSSRWKSDYFFHLIPRQPPPPSLTASPSLSASVSFCRETACSHELKINHMTERGQLYRSCITYGSVCFFFHFPGEKRAPVPK